MIDDPLKSRSQDLSSFSQRVDLYIKNKNHIIDVLQEENDRLRQQLAGSSGPVSIAPETPAVSEALSDQIEKNRQLHARMHQLQEEVRKHGDFQVREEKYRNDIAELESKNSELQEKLSQIQPIPASQTSFSADQQNESEKQLQDASDRLQTLERFLSEAEQINSELLAEKDRLVQKLAEAGKVDPVTSEVSRELQEVIRDNVNLRDSLAQAEATAREHAIDAGQTVTLRQERDLFARQLDEERGRIVDLKNQLQTAVARAQEMAKAAALAASMVRSDLPETAGVESDERYALRRQAREWREQLEAAQQRVRVLEEQEQQQKHKLEEQKVRLEAQSVEFVHQKNAIGSALSQFEALQAENLALRERLASQSHGTTRIHEDLKRHEQAVATSRNESESLHQTIHRLDELINGQNDEIKCLRGEIENWRAAHELVCKEMEEVKSATLPLYEAKQRLDAAFERERSMTAKIEALQQQKLLLEGQLSRVFFGTPPTIKHLIDSNKHSASSDAFPGLPSMEVHLPFCFPERLPMPLHVPWQRLAAKYQHKGREEGLPTFRVIRPVRFSRTFLHLALVAPALINPSPQILSVLPFHLPRVQTVSAFSGSLSTAVSGEVSFTVRSPGVSPLIMIRRAEPEIRPETGPRVLFRPVAYSLQMFLQSLEKAIFSRFRQSLVKLPSRVPASVLLRGPMPREGVFQLLDKGRVIQLRLLDGIKSPSARLTIYRIPFEMQIPRDRINMLLKGIEQTLSALTSELDQNTTASAPHGVPPKTKPS